MFKLRLICAISCYALPFLCIHLLMIDWSMVDNYGGR